MQRYNELIKREERFQLNDRKHANEKFAGLGGALWCLKITRMLLCRSNCLSYHERGGGGWKSFVFFFCYDFDTDSYEKRKNI